MLDTFSQFIVFCGSFSFFILIFGYIGMLIGDYIGMLIGSIIGLSLWAEIMSSIPMFN